MRIISLAVACGYKPPEDITDDPDRQAEAQRSWFNSHHTERANYEAKLSEFMALLDADEPGTREYRYSWDFATPPICPHCGKPMAKHARRWTKAFNINSREIKSQVLVMRCSNPDCPKVQERQQERERRAQERRQEGQDPQQETPTRRPPRVCYTESYRLDFSLPWSRMLYAVLAFELAFLSYQEQNGSEQGFITTPQFRRLTKGWRGHAVDEAMHICRNPVGAPNLWRKRGRSHYRLEDWGNSNRLVYTQKSGARCAVTSLSPVLRVEIADTG